VLQCGQVYVETEAMDPDWIVLPWQTTQPTAPLLEIDVTETHLRYLEQLPRFPLSAIVESVFEYSDVDSPSPLPVLTIRLPTDEDRLRYEEGLVQLDEELRRSVRLVSGERRLEELE
jgi:hypothetical protein